MSFRTRSMWWRWIACGLAVGWSAGLWAQEAPPARKAGLWGMTVDGRQTAMRFCVGNSGDDVMRQRPFDAVRERCEPTHWQRAGARIVAFPEAYVPGYRGLGHDPGKVAGEVLERAWQTTANAAAAARLCNAMIGAVCQPAVYEGQRLALR